MLQKRLLCNYLLELRGFSATADSQDMVIAAFLRSMFLNELPVGFLQKLIDNATSLPNSDSAIKQVYKQKLLLLLNYLI